MRSQPSSWVRKCQTLGCLPWEMTSASTLAPSTSGAPTLTASPSPTSRTSRASFAPTSPSSFSTLRRSPSWTRYCLPPVRTTAYIEAPLLPVGLAFPAPRFGPRADGSARSSKKDAGSSQRWRALSRSASALQNEARERFLVGRSGDAALGDDGGDEPRGRDVEGGIEHRGALCGDTGSREMGHLIGGAFLDGDVPCVAGAEVDGADRRRDEEGHRGRLRREGERIGSDLVRGVAVPGDAIGAHHHATDLPAGEERGCRHIGEEGHGDPVLQQFPGREARPLEPGSRLVRVDGARLSRSEGGANDAQGGPVARGREATRVAVGEDSTTLRHQILAEASDGAAGLEILLRHGIRFLQESLRDGVVGRSLPQEIGPLR